ACCAAELRDHGHGAKGVAGSEDEFERGWLARPPGVYGSRPGPAAAAGTSRPSPVLCANGVRHRPRRRGGRTRYAPASRVVSATRVRNPPRRVYCRTPDGRTGDQGETMTERDPRSRVQLDVSMGREPEPAPLAPDTPFHIALLGDFRAAGREPGEAREPRPIRVDRDDL